MVDRLVIAFIVLVTMLFIGIGIMMSPTSISRLLSSQSNSMTLVVLMTFASILFVTGLVGIGVMGFIVSKGQSAKKINT
jgi:TctA family transporter